MPRAGSAAGGWIGTGLLALLLLPLLPDGAGAAMPVWSGQPTGLGSADGGGSSALYFHPTALAVSAAGQVFVADTGNSTVRRIAADGSVVTLAGQPGVAGAADGPAASALFFAPEGVAVGPDGSVYVADTGNDTIRRIGPSGQVTTLAGAAGVPGNADGSGSAARFNQPRGLAVDAAGALYVADSANDTVRRIAPDGTVSTLAGTAGAAGSLDGPGPLALFDHPHGLALDAAGNLYVADTSNRSIRRIAPDGSVATVAGASAGWSEPTAVAADGAGVLYVADRAAGNVAVLPPSGAAAFLASGADGPAAPALPGGVAVGGDGSVYLADTYNDVIRRAASSAAPALAGPAAGPALWQAPAAAMAPGSRLVNLSARAEGGSPSGGGLMVGFVVAGAGSKSVLLRGVGPGLSAFGVADVLQNVQLELVEGGAVLSQAGAWGGASALSQAFAALGAFALASDSADAAELADLPAGSYSSMVRGSGDGSALALAEIYDADGTGSACRLVNLSVRAEAGPGSDGIFAGFVVAGPGNETVLIRGLGPALASFGLSGALASPLLVLADGSGGIIASNSGWGGDGRLSAIFSAVGAFSLPPSSNDAALLATLAPGAYSVQLGPLPGGAGGTGMIEVYEVSGF